MAESEEELKSLLMKVKEGALCPTQKLEESAHSQETRLGTRQSEISVSKRMQGLGLSPRTSEMDMTLAMNFRVDTGDPQRRGAVTGWQAPYGHNKSHKLMAQNHTPSPLPGGLPSLGLHRVGHD